MQTQFHTQSAPMVYLRSIQNLGFKSAIIAGGALRDDYLRAPISDIDIFIWEPTDSPEFYGVPDADLVEQALVGVFHTHNYDKLLGVKYGQGPGKLTNIWEFKMQPHNIQVIMTRKKPELHVAENFDIGLCKAWSNGTMIRYTHDFLTDVRDQTFTIVGQDMTQKEFDYAMETHVPKLQAKYPNFTLKVASHNQHLHNQHNHQF